MNQRGRGDGEEELWVILMQIGREVIGCSEREESLQILQKPRLCLLWISRFMLQYGLTIL